MPEFLPGQKIRDKKDGKVYDFGYISQTGMAVVYYEGECNLQDATAIPLDEIEAVEESKCCGTCEWYSAYGTLTGCFAPLPWWSPDQSIPARCAITKEQGQSCACWKKQ